MYHDRKKIRSKEGLEGLEQGQFALLVDGAQPFKRDTPSFLFLSSHIHYLLLWYIYHTHLTQHPSKNGVNTVKKVLKQLFSRGQEAVSTITPLWTKSAF